MQRRAFVAGGLAGVLASPAVLHAQTKVFRSPTASYRLVALASGLEQPWSIGFLPDGRLLITERPGRLRVFAHGKLETRPIAGVPAVRARGQGGLLDICLHPNFARNGALYLSLAGPAPEGAVTRVVRARWSEGGLADVTPIFDATPANDGDHFGSRIVFDRAGLMYVTCGERYQRLQAQQLDDLRGKVVRLRDDGSVPPDNPFVGRAGARPEIFTCGHRNPQGLALHPVSGRLWAVEHGPRGGDELNLLRAGANYGWPLATYGIDYSGAKISDHKSLPGMEEPVRHWEPSISPSGLAFYNGAAFPAWRGSLFTGALSASALVRIELDGDRYVSEERLVPGMFDIRDVRQGPDGLLYLITRSDNGGLYRIEPA
ncbi:PQQ-dependent sugar dehydrogenase [Reyranella sp. CPCC 100927]|uniref:PQQ-dependent sugar dehydrogenase n=1 Tax=Reyranella sp. CPCC 100927 TaxID=2599616 RepID=UPI0011B3DE8B|nr:PQQ-dependent sugar dehydrogenase [Reyranella sp. CPCC 100927]TWT15051.1 PQQ-dependent sugar dehydrogenase [Reyranella sp. CPCC 100927]